MIWVHMQKAKKNKGIYAKQVFCMGIHANIIFERVFMQIWIFKRVYMQKNPIFFISGKENQIISKKKEKV